MSCTIDDLDSILLSFWDQHVLQPRQILVPVRNLQIIKRFVPRIARPRALGMRRARRLKYWGRR